jgi:PAS domain S-box-containing protein
LTADDCATILIVEDDPGVARLQQLRLERAGYEVLVAANAIEALEKVKAASALDLLLLDQMLPGDTSGLELYQQIKAAGLDVPAILVTALSGDTIVLQSFRAGVYDFVPKTPEYLDYLLPTIERVLKKRRTEYKLTESEARLACIIASAQDAILTVDEKQRITLFNPAAESMFGYTSVDALGQPIQKLLPGWNAIKQAGSVPPWETDALRIDGERIPVELSVSWVQTPRRPFWTCLARDIRERRRAQEQREGLIREQAARKEAEVAHSRMAAVAHENARLYQELRHSDRLKDEFLAMLAHELRNPLAPIRNALHLIQLAGPNKPADHAECLAIIQRQVDHLVRLVDDLLDVSRISQGKIFLQKVLLNLDEVVERAVESSRPLVEAHGHELTVTLLPAPLAVDGDAVRLVQVLTNLLNNAAKYTPKGGRIELRVEQSGTKDVLLRVRDNGMGIRPEMLPRLFEPFAQSERTLDRADGGLGIGLTLVRRLTELHGGSVQAASEGPGRGSEFTIRLPLATGPVPPATPAPTAPAVAPRRRVLVVDDNEDSTSTLKRLLEMLHHDVRSAHHGDEALQLADEFVPEVFLLDIGLPGLDGYEVARRLRGDRRFEQSLLVAVTGYGSPDDRRLSQEAGFNAHLVKPVGLEDLKQVLAYQSNASSVARSKG